MTLVDREKLENNLQGMEVVKALEAQAPAVIQVGREDRLGTGWQTTATVPVTIGEIDSGARSGGSAAATTGTWTRRRSVHDAV